MVERHLIRRVVAQSESALFGCLVQLIALEIEATEKVAREDEVRPELATSLHIVEVTVREAS